MHGCGHGHGHRRRVETPRVGRVSARRDEALIPADELRASDTEREVVVTHLREQAGEGRLTVEELDERIESVYAARTRNELAALTADLPAPPRPSQHPTRARDEFEDHLRMYLLVMVLLVGIWAAAGAGYFWPVWPALGWGIGVASHWTSVRRAPRRAQLSRAARG